MRHTSFGLLQCVLVNWYRVASIHRHRFCSWHAKTPLLFVTCEDDIGWLRLVGSLKLYVSFAKEPYKRALWRALWKMYWVRGWGFVRDIRRRYWVPLPHIQMSCVTDWVMSNVQMSHVTRTNESCHTYKWVVSQIQMSRVNDVTYMNIYIKWLVWYCQV